jgi:DNA-binding transcriptional LysR family regulator
MKGSLRELRALVTLAEERHFGRAAARLGMAQPQLSELVARLEASVGAPLFERRPRVALTAAGAVLVDTARLVLQEFDRGLERARGIQAGQEGLVRIGYIGTAMMTELPAAFRAFREACPNVQLLLRESNSIGLADALEQDLIDVAFARQSWDRDGLDWDVVLTEPFVAVHAEDWAGTRADFHLSHFRDAPFSLFPPEVAPLFHEEIVEICREAGFTPRIAHVAHGWPAALALVRAGFGVTVGPACLRRFAIPGLVFHDLGGFAARSRVCMLWRRSPAPAVSRFVETVRRECAMMPPDAAVPGRGGMPPGPSGGRAAA